MRESLEVRSPLLKVDKIQFKWSRRQNSEMEQEMQTWPHFESLRGNFPGGPVAKTLCSQSREPVFDP